LTTRNGENGITALTICLLSFRSDNADRVRIVQTIREKDLSLD
jgi:hypothetical protein